MSASRIPTDAPLAANEYAKFTATVLFPTPPLQLLTHTTSLTDSSPGDDPILDPVLRSPPPLVGSPPTVCFCWLPRWRRRGLLTLTTAATVLTQESLRTTSSDSRTIACRPGRAKEGNRRVNVTTPPGYHRVISRGGMKRRRRGVGVRCETSASRKCTGGLLRELWQDRPCQGFEVSIPGFPAPCGTSVAQ